MTKNREHLSDEELVSTARLVQELQAALETKEKDTILKAVDALEDYTRPFAERLMQISIKAAMEGKKIE